MKIAIFLLLVSDLCSLSSDLVHTWRENNRQYFTSSDVNYQFSKGTLCVMYIIQWCSRVLYLQQKTDGVFAGFKEQLMEAHTEDATLKCISHCVTHTQFMTHFLQSTVPVI